jgi:hypothetical protein
MLAAAAGSLTALAGCSRTRSDEEASTSTPASATSDEAAAFERIGVDGQTLVIQLAADADLNRVNVISPDGSEFASRDVPTGVSTVEVELGVRYVPGQYRVVGVSDGASTARQDIDISPDLTITDLGVGANHLDMMPDERGQFQRFEAWVQIKNQGKGPIAIEKLLLLGGVPNPTRELETASEEEDVSGIFDANQGQGELDRVILDPGAETILFTNTLPFSFQGNGVACSSDQTEHQFRVELITIPSESVSREFKTTYTPISEDNECRISVEPR